MKLSVVLSTQPTQFQAATFSGNLENNLQAIADMGYDGVELAVRDPRLLDLEKLQESIRKYKLIVPAIGTGQAWGEEGLSFTDPNSDIRRKAIERIQSHIPLASQFQAIIIIGLIRGIVSAQVSFTQAMQWLIEALVECCHVAKESGVRLALEPINRYETSLINNVSEGMRLIDEVDAENFGLLLDSFHMNIEEPNIEASIVTCGPRIFHFHVADSNRHYAGSGHLNFQSILYSLAQTGYQGFISGEFLPLPDNHIAAAKNIAFLRGLPL
ncbi:MAG: hypothetical protein BGO78_03130 [Chloroflexi bacterium 44-23]|nr:MAG: hypothetical protein BGO78_03130 [Chloroflexi bacterium 44-23]